MKRFSVVMPVHNPDPEQMRFALQSARGQIIIVDDASDDVDVSVSLAQEFGAALYREEESHGLVAAVNFGIDRAEGEYIHVLPPDCYCLNGFYPVVDLMIRTHGFRSMVACRWLEMDENGRVVEAFMEKIPRIAQTPWPACAFVARRDWYESHPWPDLPFHQAAEAIVRAGAMDHILANWPMVTVPQHRSESVLAL